MRAIAVFIFAQCVTLSAFSTPANLDAGVSSLAQQFIQLGGEPRSLEQLRCFLNSHGEQVFKPRPVQGELSARCNLRETIQLTNFKAAAIIDFTKDSNRPRFFIFDLINNKVHALHVGHGRFGNTDRDNTRFSENPKRNSILRVRHFSNVINSNASAGGFFLTGHDYQGAYGRSRVLHGLEAGFNDNACERMTVIHKSGMITENATRRMSSGCPMVSRERMEQVHALLGEGALVYTYTPAEAALPAGTCGRNLLR